MTSPILGNSLPVTTTGHTGKKSLYYICHGISLITMRNIIVNSATKGIDKARVPVAKKHDILDQIKGTCAKYD